MIINDVKQHGFIPDVIAPEDYVFGSNELVGEILKPDGQWDDCLPDEEVQFLNDLEVYNCTAFGTINCIEIVLNKCTDKNNYSDRYVGTLAQTWPPGNSPHKVAETIRNTSGLVEEELLPFSPNVKTLEQYYSLENRVDTLIKRGKEWLGRYEFKHDWVFTNYMGREKQIKQLVGALQYSPLGVSVMAWRKGHDGLYEKEEGEEDTHWTVLYGYEYGKYWKVFDSYTDSGTVLKKLRWDYPFGFAKRYYIKKKVGVSIVKGFWERLLDFISSLFNP